MAAGEQAATALVSAAEIARLAGVTRAAVSNWRRRHTDFPAPTSGTATSPLFDLAQIQQWLERQGKAQGVSGEVDLWHALRAQYGDDMLAAMNAVGDYLASAVGIATSTQPDTSVCEILDALLAERTAEALFAALVDRFLASAARTSGESLSTPRLTQIVTHFAGPVSGTVYDPACGIGSLLLVAGTAGTDEGPAVRVGQDLNPASTRLAVLRGELGGAVRTLVADGDSLRGDQFPELQAELVVCEPPVGGTDWGRDSLLLDPRWELGVPPRAESELAWVQHCYAHTAPGGRALIVLPASVAYRKAGRRIRAELVRRGILSSVVALPPGLIANHALPVHLWILRRPAEGEPAGQHVRMIDLTGADTDSATPPSAEQTAEIPLVELLDDEVDLSPGRYVIPARPDYPAEYIALRTELESLVRGLVELLPELSAGPGSLEAATADVGSLVRGGLVALDGDTAFSTTDQLDSDYLRGFLRSAANTRRSTSGTGTFRSDARSARLPRMDIDRQRRYGTAFRQLGDFETRLREAAELGARAAGLAFDGLTTGALLPPAQSSSTGGTSESRGVYGQ